MTRVDARGEPMLPVEDEEKDMSEQAVVRRARAALRVMRSGGRATRSVQVYDC